MNVLLLGKGTMAIGVAKWLLHRGYNISYIVPVMPEPEWSESLITWSALQGIHFQNNGDWKGAVGQYDLALSIFYDRRIGQSLIDRCGHILNLHNGLLPKYRGCRPLNWALKNGEKTAGCTLHEVTPRFDDGAIVGQVEFDLYPHDEVRDAYRRACAYGFTLVTQMLPLLGRIKARPQDETLAKYYTLADAKLLGDRSGWKRE